MSLLEGKWGKIMTKFALEMLHIFEGASGPLNGVRSTGNISEVVTASG